MLSWALNRVRTVNSLTAAATRSTSTPIWPTAGGSGIRAWFNSLLELRVNSNVKGPSPLAVVYAQEQQLGFVRGHGSEYYTLANFGGRAGWKSLAELDLPRGCTPRVVELHLAGVRRRKRRRTHQRRPHDACSAETGCTSQTTER